jgi:hypothetical protein
MSPFLNTKVATLKGVGESLGTIREYHIARYIEDQAFLRSYDSAPRPHPPPPSPVSNRLAKHTERQIERQLGGKGWA